MSERKVLNKYYPPDFDPSRIPKSKEPRNKTFCIRLMAPCNMRCTTCGEYIYKGRKFNARKEDVDDMNYLGLRIYRFYIKCTACVSEICFRTDPENTDYVLESGATRNFEALKRAEEIAEREEKARQEELENNPMKLLEERTLASKNELELAESLDELRELNKRTVNVDYETMLKRYEKERQSALDAQEKADEEFVRKIFSNQDGVKIKRVLDDDDSSDGSGSDDGAKNGDAVKKAKTEDDKVTDILTGSVTGAKKPEKKPEVWEKSIGSLQSGKKNKLGILVKKKGTAAPSTTTTTTTNNSFAVPKVPAVVASKSPSVTAKKSANSPANQKLNGSSCQSETSTKTTAAPSGGGAGLGLLGAYSDSDSNSD